VVDESPDESVRDKDGEGSSVGRPSRMSTRPAGAARTVTTAFELVPGNRRVLVEVLRWAGKELILKHEDFVP